MNSDTDITGATQRPDQASNWDIAYTPGRPASTYLSPREIVRLTILRSKIRHNSGDVGPIRLLRADAQPDVRDSSDSLPADSAAPTNDQS